MFVALIADTHGYLPVIPKFVSAVIHAGDIGIDRGAIGWFRDLFYPWVTKLGVPVYATFGNHDRIGETRSIPDGIPPNLYLCIDSLENVLDVPTYFSPWSMKFYNWAYMADDNELSQKYAKIPDITEVLVTHGPPYGAGDRVESGERVGSPSLLVRIEQLPNLNLVVTGHIHEDYGTHFCHSGLPVLNVTHVDLMYRPVHPPTIIEWPPRNWRKS